MRKKKFMAFAFLTSFLLVDEKIAAQPYIDLGKIYYGYTPKRGLNKKDKPISSGYFNININAPIELQKDGDAILINPFIEWNSGTVSGNDFSVVTEGVSAGFLEKIKGSGWSVFTAIILRRNKEIKKDLNDDWQYGCAILASYKKNTAVTFNLGLYYNKEFFGNFFMPLVGIDWKINSKNNLFGVLPGNLVFEHSVNRSFYYGSVFRAITGSYRLSVLNPPCDTDDCSGESYLRIDDNQLGLFSDVYLAKNIVLTGEAGYTILRNYRYGFKGDDLHIKTNNKSDNYYFRISLSYRIRIKK